jgi:DNA replicative helicase MCM subunit Mcm2 (Cdc46/Mcm family)
LVTGKKTTARTKEKIIRDAIESCADANGVADRNEVLTEIVRNGMQSSEAEDLIDKMVQQGGLLRPRGYDTLMVA